MIDGWSGKVQWNVKNRKRSHLDIKDITDIDYACTNRVCQDFKI